MSENSIGLKTQVLEGLLEQTLGQRYYAFSSSITLCCAGSGWDSNQKDFKQIRFLDITTSRLGTAGRDVPERGYRLEGTWHHRMADPVTTPVF
jgi:hypothetical protein